MQKQGYISYNKKVYRFFNKLSVYRKKEIIYPLKDIITNRENLKNASQIINNNLIHNYVIFNIINTKTIVEYESERILNAFLYKKIDNFTLNCRFNKILSLYKESFYYVFYYTVLNRIMLNTKDLLRFQNDVIRGYKIKNRGKINFPELYGILKQNPNATKLVLKANINIKKCINSFLSELRLVKTENQKLLSLIKNI